jgi:hypothetical protein
VRELHKSPCLPEKRISMRRSIRSIAAVFIFATLTFLISTADAQAQRVRVGVGVHVSSGPRIVRTYRPYYYRPYYYDSFYFGSWWGPYGWYPSVWYPQPRYRAYYDQASIRIQVSPKEAEVYVDGYYVGIVDSFDGTFQRLDVPPGEHVIEIFHEGHRTIRETMRFEPRAGYHLKRAMEPLRAGDPPEMRPKPEGSGRQPYPPERGNQPPDERQGMERPRDMPRGYPPDRPEERRNPPDRQGERRGEMREGESGAVAIRVQPAGAIVLIDGEKWDGPEGPERLVVHLSEGPHKVEVQKQGYRTFTTEIRIGRGETIPLNISLRTAGQ